MLAVDKTLLSIPTSSLLTRGGPDDTNTLAQIHRKDLRRPEEARDERSRVEAAWP